MKNSRLLLIGIFVSLVLASAYAQKPTPKPIPVPKPTTPTEQPQAEKTPAGAHVFCVFGDTRPDGDPKRLAIVSKLAAAMAREHPEFVIGTGDYVDGASTAAAERKQYDDFFRALKPLQMYGPVSLAAAAGNHDVSGGMGSLWGQSFGKRYYSFDLGKAHFIILDTEGPGQVGRIEGAQWDWLYQDLVAARNTPLIFVALHEPLFPVSVHRGSSLDKYTKFRDRLHTLFAQFGVNAVFAGHEHLYNHQKRDGVNYFITAGAGAPLYANASNGGFYHYLKVTYTDSDYTVEVKRL